MSSRFLLGSLMGAFVIVTMLFVFAAVLGPHDNAPSAGLLDLSPEAALQVTERVRIKAEVEQAGIQAREREHARTTQTLQILGGGILGCVLAAIIVNGVVRAVSQRSEAECYAVTRYAADLRAAGRNVEPDFVDGVWSVVDHDRREVVPAGVIALLDQAAR